MFKCKSLALQNIIDPMHSQYLPTMLFFFVVSFEMMQKFDYYASSSKLKKIFVQIGWHLNSWIYTGKFRDASKS